ncbi:MAG: Crp/Fnr family transcriptional regulator [Deltaproteobacteria bacterium]|nr:Crp/Fnr family transcriptional regulator [Deltaproteobacteria bacterium]
MATFGKTFSAGEVLFKEGDIGNEMFVLQSGKIRLTRLIRGKEQHLVDLAGGEFFGEMAILNNKPRSATAVCLEESKALVIDPKTFEQMIKANAEIGVRMIKKMAERLDEANEQIESLHLRDANSRVVHSLLLACKGVPKDLEGGVRLAITTFDIHRRTELDPERIDAVLQRTTRSRLAQVDAQGVYVPNVQKLEDFMGFLEMP